MSDTLRRLIISADAGSLFDKIGKAAGEGLQRALSRSILLENFGDSGGVGGAEAGVKADPDGSTILICNKGAMTSHPHTAKTYKTDDFAVICQVAEAPIAVAVSHDSPFKSISDLIDLARKKPSTVTYSTPNPYHTQRLAMEDFAARNDVKFNFVVLPGGNTASIQQLTEHKVHFAFLAAHNLLKPQQAGEIRVLAVAHGERLPFLAEVPTFREAGFDLVTAIWLGLFAPAAVPGDRLKELRMLADKAIRDSATIEAIKKLNVVPAYMDSTTFSKKIASDTQFHLGVLRRLGAV